MTLKSNRDEIVKFTELYKEHLTLNSSRSNRTLEQTARLATLRSQINQSVPIITSYIREVGEPVTIYYSPPPAVGGLTGSFDLLANIFNPSLMGTTQHTLDMLDRAIGRYEFLIRNRWKRWVNPFHWIGEIIRIPFYLLKFSGFDGNKIEFSIVGKIYKAFVSVTALIGSLMKLYEYAKPYLQSKGITAP